MSMQLCFSQKGKKVHNKEPNILSVLFIRAMHEKYVKTQKEETAWKET